MADFWTEYDKPYRLFSQYCDSDDWYTILKAVSGAIAKNVPKKNSQISVLDVGSGNGIASQAICEHLYTMTGCFPSLSIGEPSDLARTRLSGNILGVRDSGPLIHAVGNLRDLPEDYKVDVITFLHSTYYIDEFEEYLDTLVKRHLRQHGVICALVLPEDSPFFLGYPGLPNCSDFIESVFKRLDMKTDTVVLRSRFLVPHGGFSENELTVLRPFFMPSATSNEAFKKRLEDFAVRGEIDFQDHLIVGRLK